jgi:hypothetical protein
VYRELQSRLTEHFHKFLKQQYQIDIPNIGVNQPPSVEMGEYALTLCFELAKQLRKAPRKIAEEIVASIGPIPGFEKLEVAGAGYINARVDRTAMATAIADGIETPSASGEKILVEHTSINPNKAAHIGHLRNAILGDTFVRMLRTAGSHVDIQNYIDNTVSSEIGEAFGSPTYLVSTWKRAEPGTDGGVSLLGTFAGVASALTVCAVALALRVTGTIVWVCAIAGVAGMFADSLLGAALERRGWLNNDSVNLLSTAVAAGIAISVLK